MTRRLPTVTTLSALAVLAWPALVSCGDDDTSSASPSGDGPDSETSAGPVVEDVVACLTEAGRDASEVDAESRRRVEVRYSFDTTKIDFLESAEDAASDLEFGEAYDFEDFTVGSVYVLLGSLDEDALADRATIEGCLT